MKFVKVFFHMNQKNLRQFHSFKKKDPSLEEVELLPHEPITTYIKGF